MDLSLPAFIGITTPGKSTVFVRGRIGNTSGKLSFSSASSSSFVINGIKSDSSLISSNDILSILLKIMLIQNYLWSLCQKIKISVHLIELIKFKQ